MIEKKENTNPTVYKNNSLVVYAADQNNDIPSGHKAWSRAGT